MLAFTLLLLTQIGSPQGVRLLDDAPLQVQVTPGLQSDAQVSAQQLQADIDGLKKMRQGLGAGVTLVAIGGSGAALGAINLALSSVLSGGGGINIFVVLGVIGFGVGLPLLTIGVWILYNRLEERKRIDDETTSLKKELLRRRAQPANRPYIPPPQFDLQPPQTRGPDASLILAQFD